MNLHTLVSLLMVLVLFLTGATGAGVNLRNGLPGPVNLNCIQWLISGTDEASNLDDWCSAAGQAGPNDATIVNDVDCTHENVPPASHADRRSCDFDGADDALSTPQGVLGEPKTACYWVAPDAEGVQVVWNHWNALAPQLGWAADLAGLKFNALHGVGYTGTVGDTSHAIGNNWTFGCMKWGGLASSGLIQIYNSRISDSSNSILDCDNGGNACFDPTDDYVDPVLPYAVGLTSSGGFWDFAGQIGEVVILAPEIPDTEICQGCRCGWANMQEEVGGLTFRYNTYDRAAICNQCTLPTNDGVQVTHCGPRRIL